jgi:hypothetical protein
LADAVPEPAALSTAITSSIAEPQRAAVGSTPGWPGWLATQTSLEYAGQKTNMLLNPRCLPGAGRQDDRKIRAAASSSSTSQ